MEILCGKYIMRELGIVKELEYLLLRFKVMKVYVNFITQVFCHKQRSWALSPLDFITWLNIFRTFLEL